jgi:hypothetical protein
LPPLFSHFASQHATTRQPTATTGNHIGTDDSTHWRNSQIVIQRTPLPSIAFPAFAAFAVQVSKDHKRRSVNCHYGQENSQGDFVIRH